MLLVITSKEHTLIKDIVMSEKITLKGVVDEIEYLRELIKGLTIEFEYSKQIINQLSQEINILKDNEKVTFKQGKKVVIIQDEPIIIKAKKNE